MAKETNLIRVSEETKSKLNELKVHPRQSYDEVLANLAAKNEELLKRVQALESYLALEVGYTQHSAEDKIKRITAERDAKAAKDQVEEAEAKRKIDLFDQLKNNLPKCPECESPLALVEGLEQPRFSMPIWLRLPTKNARDWLNFWIECTCTSRNCLKRINLYPDKPGALIEQSPKKGKKSLSDGYLPSVG